MPKISKISAQFEEVCATPPLRHWQNGAANLTEQQHRDDESLRANEHKTSKNTPSRKEETSTLVNIWEKRKVFEVLRKCRVFYVPKSYPKKISWVFTARSLEDSPPRPLSDAICRNTSFYT